MSIYEYIQREITRERFNELVRVGLINVHTSAHLEIYEWHIRNGRSQMKTAKHFRIPASSVGYAVTKMTRQINTKQWH